MSDHELDADNHELLPDEVAARLATKIPVRDPLNYSESLRAADVEGQPIIRLLHLHPGTQQIPISGDLETVQLASSTSFEALSYCWGSPEPKYSICVDGAYLSVTENLKLALFRLRHVSQVRTLWIDGICINQQDNAEKSYQVGLMRNIYLKAANTIVWLGEERGGSRLAFDLCTRMLATHGNDLVKETFSIDVKQLYRKQLEAGSQQNMEDFASTLDLNQAAFRAGYDAVKTLSAKGGDAAATAAARETMAQLLADPGTGDEVDEVAQGLAKMLLDGTLEGTIREAIQQVARGEEYTGLYKDIVYEGYAEAMQELEEESRAAESAQNMGAETVAGATESNITSGGSELSGQDAAAQTRTENPEQGQGAAPDSCRPTTMTRFYERLVLEILTDKQDLTSKEPPTLDEVKALQCLVRRAWFRRIWIVQEAGVSEAISVQCGSSTIDWWTFYYGFLITTRLNRHALLGPAHYQNILLMSETRDGLQHALRPTLASATEEAKSVLDLLHLLRVYRSYLATDPRDKVFALLGIAQSDSKMAVLSVDYQQGLPDIYTQVAQALLTNSTFSHLDLFAIPQGHGAATEHTPSWVPDWSDSERMPYPLAGNHSWLSTNSGTAVPLRVFSASGSSTSSVMLLGTDKLRIRGCLFDTILQLADVMHVGESDLDLLNPDNMATEVTAVAYIKSVFNMFGSIPTVMKQWKALAKYDCEPTAYFNGTEKATRLVRSVWKTLAKVGIKHNEYPTGEDNFTVFARTLWADLKTPVECSEEARSWMYKMKDIEYLMDSLPPAASFEFEATEDNMEKFYKEMGPAMRKMKRMSWADTAVACVHVLERRLARSSKGYLCLLPAETQIGDEIALLQGGRTPYILRSTSAGRRLIGEAYVHGIMYGEAWNEEGCAEIILV